MSNSEQCSNRLELDLISLLVNFSYELGQIMARFDFLWPRWVIVSNQTDFQLCIIDHVLLDSGALRPKGLLLMYLVSSGFSFKPTSSSSSSSSTQFSQEWVRRKVVVKHSIKIKKNTKMNIYHIAAHSWISSVYFLSAHTAGRNLVMLTVSLCMRLFI